MSETYRLNTTRHESIYADKIAARYLPKSHPQEQPCAVITGGQPGSGKSGVTDIAIGRFRETGFVLVDADKLRRFHPNYMQLMQSNDKIAANLTHPDAGRWAERLMRDGVAERRNIIIDQTSRDPVAMARMTQGLKEAGYRVELHIIATPERVSEQRIYERYEGQRERDGYGRFSTKDKHDEAYLGVAKTIAAVEAGKQVDRLCVYDRHVRAIYDNSFENGQWQKEPLALKTFEQERNRPMTLQERKDYLAGFDKLAVQLSRPERRASEQEIRHIQDLHQQAKVSLAAEIFRQEPPEKAAQQFPELAPALHVMKQAAQHFETQMPGNAEAQRQALAQVRQHVQSKLDQGETQDFRRSDQVQEQRQPTRGERATPRDARPPEPDMGHER